MGKKKRQKPSMTEWIDGQIVPIGYLLSPLHRIILDGYKFERKASSSFDYVGYNIGETERLYSPTPAERFTSRWLNNEAKFNRTLLENTMITIFQLGMEYSRRLDAQHGLPRKVLEDLLNQSVSQNAALRSELSEYDDKHEEKEIPMISDIEDLIIEDFIELDETKEVDAINTKEEN